jgi:uncharacterized protein (TIGR03437 family)
VRRAVWLFLGFVLATRSAPAQELNGLATNYDGSVLYFSSSFTLRDALQNSDTLQHPKIFKWTRQDGFTIFAQRPNLGDDGTGVSNPYTLVDPRVTADGSLVSFLGTRVCYSNSGFKGFFCNVPNIPETTVVEGGQQTAMPGRALFSANGRYVLDLVSGTTPNTALTATWTDRETGERLTPSLGAGVSTAHAFTDDGRVLFFGDRKVMLWSKSGVRAFPADADIRDAGISANGRTIALMGWDLNSGRNRAFLIDVESGRLTETPGTVSRLSLSADGSYLLLLGQDPNAEKDVQRQAFLIRTDGSDQWQITIAREGVRDAVLAGDGHSVYAVTNLNAILRYDVDTGETEEIAPRSPFVDRAPTVGVPGSLLRLSGSALALSAQTFATSLPRFVDGDSVRLDGSPVPIRHVDPWGIEFQIPWNTPLGERILRFPAPMSPFAEPEFRLTVAPFHPGSVGGPYHQDGVTQLNGENPALPGEMIYVDLSGLGELDSPLADGVPAPANPPLHARRAVGLKLTDRQGNSIDLVAHQGTLVPGTFGTYRVGVRIPTTGLTPDLGSDQVYAALMVDPGGLFGPAFAGYIPIQLK